MATVKGVVGNFSASAWFLVGGFVVTIFATFFPYATLSVNFLGSLVFSQEVSLNGTSRFVIFALVAASAYLALPALSGSETAVWRLGTLSALVGLLAVLMVIWFTSVSSDNHQAQGDVDVSPGFGLLMYGAGVCVMAVGVVRLWRLHVQRPRNAAY